jgi:uncharacterized protein (DUF924 family)
LYGWLCLKSDAIARRVATLKLRQIDSKAVLAGIYSRKSTDLVFQHASAVAADTSSVSELRRGREASGSKVTIAGRSVLLWVDRFARKKSILLKGIILGNMIISLWLFQQRGHCKLP